MFTQENVMSNILNKAISPMGIGQQRSPTTADDETMEHLFQALFYRISVLYARVTPN